MPRQWLILITFCICVAKSCRSPTSRSRSVPSSEGGAEVCGECNLRAAKEEQIKRLKIEPQQIKAVPEVLRAIDEADAIILGPGSLYTSVLPNLLVGGVAAHIKRARGTVFISIMS